MNRPPITIQPFGYYLYLTDSDHMHYGYWPEDNRGLSLSEAQDRHTELLHQRIKGQGLRILDVGCGLGASTRRLYLKGHEVVGIAPSSELVQYARDNNPGPEYIDCGFLAENPDLFREDSFDLVIFQESMQYLPDLGKVFERLNYILKAEGRAIICDEVSRDPLTKEKADVHSSADIEAAFGREGFFVRWHLDMSAGVGQTTEYLTALFQSRRDELIDHFGKETQSDLDLYISGWNRTRDWYREGIFGYEAWELQPSDFTVRSYQEGDEKNILPAFGTAFSGPRSAEHWDWKFKRNPYGGPMAVIVQDRNDGVASHFSAYPVPFSMDGKVSITHQVGDTFTLPAYRGEGRGRTSLLARAVRLFRRTYCEGKIDFYYGFNTGKIQAFGSRFLDYIPAGPVSEYRADRSRLERTLGKGVKYRLHGYRARIYETPDRWADEILEGARRHYVWFVNRSSEYLDWRYSQCPDGSYTFLVIYRWNKPVGWLLIQMGESEIVIGDALFAEVNEKGIEFALSSLLRYLNRSGELRSQISGWFSPKPEWWSSALQKLGFEKTRQPQKLDLCLSIFSEDLQLQDFKDKMYYTKGDSDLL